MGKSDDDGVKSPISATTKQDVYVPPEARCPAADRLLALELTAVTGYAHARSSLRAAHAI
jgi:hypothetical protein